MKGFIIQRRMRCGGKRPRVARWWSMVAIVAAVMVSKRWLIEAKKPVLAA